MACGSFDNANACGPYEFQAARFACRNPPAWQLQSKFETRFRAYADPVVLMSGVKAPFIARLGS
jgi:hypothetical protein